jgi:WD40 repeat protein
VFNQDENRILTWGADWTARLWAVGQNEPIQTFKHEQGVEGAVFNHDESRIQTWGRDGRARLWAVGQNEPIQTFEHEEWEWARGAVFNHDESRILTWSGDGTARLWDIRLDENIPPDERILDFQVRSATNLYGSVSLKYLSFDERAAASQTLQEMRSTRAHSK